MQYNKYRSAFFGLGCNENIRVDSIRVISTVIRAAKNIIEDLEFESGIQVYDVFVNYAES
jgi:hypothetical protein